MSEAKSLETPPRDGHVSYPAASINGVMGATVEANTPPNSASEAPGPAAPSWLIGEAA